MTATVKTLHQTAAEFFFEHAGYSYDPAKETKLQGRRRCAARLSKSEQWAAASGVSYKWELDNLTNREFTNYGPEYSLWSVLAYGGGGNIIGSLGGVDFGVDGQPWGNPYARVVEAELALEAMPGKAGAR